MSTSSESIPVEEENQPCASASKQPEIYITHVYTTNSDASDSSPVKLSAAAKAVMLQQELQQQQQQAKQKEGSTGIIRRSCRQRKRPRYFPPLEVRIPAARRRQQKASSPPDLQDALGYIDKVKLAYLPDNPYVYHAYLDSMQLFRDGRATTKELMEMIIALFGNDGARGRECVLAFSAFCPPGWGIRQGDGEGEWVLIMP